MGQMAVLSALEVSPDPRLKGRLSSGVDGSENKEVLSRLGILAGLY